MAEKKIEICFWCGNPKDENISHEDLLKAKTDNDIVINNYRPCDRCKKMFGKGIHVIGVTDKPIAEGMFPISKSSDQTLYPTGSMFVASEEFILDLLSDDAQKELRENVLKERVLMMPDSVVEGIVNDAREHNQGENLDINSALLDDEGEKNEENVQDQSNEESLDGDRS
jgi:hypothetical protein